MKSRSFENLKKLATESEDLSEVMTYFFDHIAKQASFLDRGDPTENEVLQAVIQRIGSQIMCGPAKISDLLLIRVPELKFFHGGFLLSGNLANVIYFEDLKIGVMAVAMSLATGETRYVRFTEKGRVKGPNPSLN